MKIVPIVLILTVFHFCWGQPPAPAPSPSRRYGYDNMDNGYHSPLGWGPRFGSTFRRVPRGHAESGNWYPVHAREALQPLQRLPQASRAQGPAYFNYQSDEDAATRYGRSYTSDSTNEKPNDFNDVDNNSDLDEGGVNVGGLLWTRPRTDQKVDEDNHIPDCGCNHNKVASLTKDATAAAANAATASAIAARAAAQAAAAAVCTPEAGADQQEDDVDAQDEDLPDNEDDAPEDERDAGEEPEHPFRFRTEYPNRNHNYQGHEMNFRDRIGGRDTRDDEFNPDTEGNMGHSPGIDGERYSRGTPDNRDYSRDVRREMNSWRGISSGSGRNSQDAPITDDEFSQGSGRRDFSMGIGRSEVNSRKRTTGEEGSQGVTDSEFSRGSGSRDFSQGVGVGTTWSEVNSRRRSASEAKSQGVNGSEFPRRNGERDFSGTTWNEVNSRRSPSEANSQDVNGSEFSDGNGERDFSQGIGTSTTWSEVNSRKGSSSETQSQDVTDSEFSDGNGERDFSQDFGTARSDGKSRKSTNMKENSQGVTDGEKFSRRTISGREFPKGAIRKEINSLGTTDTGSSFPGVTDTENYSEEATGSGLFPQGSSRTEVNSRRTTSSGFNSQGAADSDKFFQGPSISSEFSQSHAEREITPRKNEPNLQGTTYNGDNPQGSTGKGINSRRNMGVEANNTQNDTGSVVYSQGPPGRGINTQRTSGLVKSSDDKSILSKMDIPDAIKKNFLPTNSSNTQGIPLHDAANLS